MALRDAGSAGNNCMLLSVLAASDLPPDAIAMRGRIADAIDAMTDSEREAFLKDVVEPGEAVSDPSAVLGPTFTRDFELWSSNVRTGSSMLGAAELHVLRRLLEADGIDVEVTSLRSLSDSKTAAAWARTQREAHGGGRKLVLIATDGTHYNWVPEPEPPLARPAQAAQPPQAVYPVRPVHPSHAKPPQTLRGGCVSRRRGWHAMSVLRAIPAIVWAALAFLAFRSLSSRHSIRAF